MTARPDILCIGSALWDLIGRAGSAVAPGGDMPGRITRRPGGVALNIAFALAALGHRPALLSALGADTEGEALIAEAAEAGVLTTHVHRAPKGPTGRYMAIEDPAGLIAAIADAATLEAAGDAILAPLADGRLAAPSQPWRGVAVFDGNLTEACLAAATAGTLLASADLRLVSASHGKATRLRPLLGHPGVTVYANRAEAGLIAARPFRDAVAAAEGLRAAGARRAVVTDGAERVAQAGPDGTVAARPPPVLHRSGVTGAGDHFLAAHLAAELAGAAPEAALAAGLDAAAAHIGKGDSP